MLLRLLLELFFALIPSYLFATLTFFKCSNSAPVEVFYWAGVLLTLFWFPLIEAVGRRLNVLIFTRRSTKSLFRDAGCYMAWTSFLVIIW